MPDFLTQFSDACQAQLETSRRISAALFAGTGKLDHTMLEASHRAVDEQLRYAQAIGNTRDMQIFANLQSTFLAARPEQLQMFQQEWMRILAEMQNEIGRATQVLVEQFSTNMMRSMSSAMPLQAGRSAGPAVNPIADVMSAWDKTVRGMSQFASQAGAAGAGSARASESMLRTEEAAIVAFVDKALEEDDDAADSGGEKQDAAPSSRKNGNGTGAHAKREQAPADDKTAGSPKRK